MNIREANYDDWDSIWPIFSEIVTAGETYAFPTNSTKDQAVKIWLETPRKTFVCEDSNQIIGSYFLKTNQAGPGSHVCNCAYMVASKARGRGAAKLMCEHSQSTALALGYKAMQFNFVVSTNHGAVSLWQKLGFEIVGRLPRAFNHRQKGYVDALVMYKWLET